MAGPWRDGDGCSVAMERPRCVPVLPNVRAEATGEVGRLWPAADNGACDCRLPAKGGLPRRGASRAGG